MVCETGKHLERCGLFLSDTCHWYCRPPWMKEFRVELLMSVESHESLLFFIVSNSREGRKRSRISAIFLWFVLLVVFGIECLEVFDSFCNRRLSNKELRMPSILSP